MLLLLVVYRNRLSALKCSQQLKCTNNLSLVSKIELAGNYRYNILRNTGSFLKA